MTMEWARPILARIMLRREFGREPTVDEVGDRMEKLKQKPVSIPLLDTITAAFENGEEVRPFHRCIPVPTTKSVFVAESVSMETRVQSI